MPQKLTLGYLLPFLFLLCSSAYANALLNGLAVHEELGNEQFIGALYSETLSDNADALTNGSSAMRMELKIVTPDGVTTRRFRRMWIEGMAINNPSQQLTAQAENMVKFDGMFKGRLEMNDHVVFSQTPGEGVKISVNKVLLGSIADDEFFPMLLRTWIGRVPLSSTYRENLLQVGKVSSDLQNRYNAITPSSSRVTAIQSWLKPAEPEPEPVVAAVPEPKPVIAAAKTTAAVAAPKIDLPALRQASSASSVAAVAAAVAKPQPEPAKPAPVKPVEPEEEPEPVLTAQSLLARQFYVSELLKQIRSKVTYPRRAIARGHEGGMRVAVTIDRKGEILTMSWLERSEHDTLNKEGWESIQRAAPFPVMPDVISDSHFEFSAPITFALPK